MEIRVVEHLFRWINWDITEKSDPFTKTNAQTMEFRVPVKARRRKDASLHRALFVVSWGHRLSAEIV